MKFIIGKEIPRPYGVYANPESRCWDRLAFAISPVVHDTYTQAEAEAARLALKEPGCSFIIFKAMSHTEIPAIRVNTTRYD